MEDNNNNIEENEQKLENEVAPALIAIHPTQISVSVAVGSNLRVFNLENGSEAKLTDGNGGHIDSIRAIKYSKNGLLFVSSGDDKIVKIWETNSWRCVFSVVSEKRVTAVAISDDEGKYVCFADKFGVVYVVDIGDECGLEISAVVVKKAVPILSHYCSIITRLEFSPDGNYILSADRDFKIRVTMFPKKPLDGAHEIQSFCLGHTEFVSCLAFVSSPDHSQQFLVSGSGDSTVRLWEHTSGCLLDTCNVADMAGLRHTTEQEDISFAVTDLCTNSDGSLVAVAIQSLPGMVLLRCNLSAKTLSLTKVVHITGEAFIPTSLGASLSSPLLWMVMGASSLQHVHASESLARVRVISGFTQINDSDFVEPEMLVLEDNAIPGGESLLQALQGKLSIGNKAFSMVAEAVKTSMRNLMIKKQYSAERREVRKKGRNDKKNSVIV